MYGRPKPGEPTEQQTPLDGPYDGYAECVKVVFDEKCTSVTELMEHLFEIIDPYSLNKQGVDVGKSIARASAGKSRTSGRSKSLY
ncbi:MAG: peptide-methionine (S)-S-oxide reductase [Faecalibacterium sp.]